MQKKANHNQLNNIIDYFNKHASEYYEKSTGKWWGILRKRELKSCIELLEPHEDELILDAGCGAGYYTRALVRHKSKLWAVDISEEMLKQIENIGVEKIIKGDIADIHLSNIFDKILCTGVLEFCSVPQDAIANLAKHLKVGGRLVLLVPKKSLFGYIYYLFHKSHKIKVHLFRTKELINMCQGIGLTFIKASQPSFSMALRFDKI